MSNKENPTYDLTHKDEDLVEYETLNKPEDIGLIVIRDEPTLSFLAKWSAWLILVMLLIWFVLSISKTHTCDLEGLENKINKKKYQRVIL